LVAVLAEALLSGLPADPELVTDDLPAVSALTRPTDRRVQGMASGAQVSLGGGQSQVSTSTAGAWSGRGRCPLPRVERRAAQEAHSRVASNATTGVSPQSGRVRGSVA